MKKKILVFCISILFVGFSVNAEKIKVFWGLKDPNSFIQKMYLNKLENEYDNFSIKENIEMYEVDYNEKNFNLFEKERKRVVDGPFGYVPFTVFQENFVVGTDYDKLEKLVKKQMVVNFKKQKAKNNNIKTNKNKKEINKDKNSETVKNTFFLNKNILGFVLLVVALSVLLIIGFNKKNNTK